jgi:hypothetical protein
VPVLFTKFKEKRVLDDIDNTMQSLMLSIELGEILEIITSGLKAEKAPAAKVAMMAYLEKAIRTTYIDPLRAIKDELAKIPKSYIEDSNAPMRDQAFAVIGVMSGRLGEDEMSSYTSGLIPVKMKKVQDAAATVKPSEYDVSEKDKKKAAAAAKKAGGKPASAAKQGFDDMAVGSAASAAAASQAMDVDMDDNFMASKKPAADKGDTLMMDDAGPPKRAPPKLG